MKVAVSFCTLIVLAIVQPYVNAIRSAELDALWKPIVEVNSECPRFIYVNTGHDGMGDQLERLSMGLALAYKAKEFDVQFTLVVSDDWENVSESLHGGEAAKGYHNVYYDVFGLPHFQTLGFIHKEWKGGASSNKTPRLLKENEYMEYLTSTLSTRFIEIPCHTIVDVDIYDVCNGSWCPFTIGWDIQRVVAPLLRESYANAGNSCHVIPDSDAANNSSNSGFIHVVWHVRTFLLETDKNVISCSTCDPSYIPRVQQILSTAIKEIDATTSPASTTIVKNTIIIKAHKTHAQNMMNPYFGDDVHLLLSNDVKEVVCEFLRADVLISTGSSFPSMVSKFSPRNHPILIEELRHNLRIDRQKIQWITSPEDSFHMKNGTLVGGGINSLNEKELTISKEIWKSLVVRLRDQKSKNES
jgi:hypothetical protein